MRGIKGMLFAETGKRVGSRRDRFERSGRLLLFSLAAVAAGAATARAQFTIGQNFTGTSSANVANLTGFQITPPDTMGTVGLNHFVEFTNGSFAVYNKTGNGATGTPVMARTSLDQFWRDAGITGLSGTTGTADPRVVYDRFTNRYYAATIDFTPDANNAGDVLPNNRILVAVSNTADPTQGFKGFAVTSPSGRFADFPTLGLNRDGVYIATNDFPTSTSPPSATDFRVGLLFVPKASLTAATPSVSGFRFFNNASDGVGIDPNTSGGSVQPAFDQNNGTGSEPLLSAFNNTNLKRSNLTGTDTGSPTLSTAGGLIGVPNQGDPPQARQPGGPNTIDAGDQRFSSNVILQNGKLWGVQTVNNGGRAALRWVRIDQATNALEASGLIADANRDYYYGSIAVNEVGNLVIGFSGSSDLTTTGFSGFASSFAVVGNYDGTTTNLLAPTLLKEGVASYDTGQQIGIPGIDNRFGDYSATTLDPNDPTRFWTIQEWVSAPNQWSTQITEIRVNFAAVPEPGSLALALTGGGVLTGAFMRRRRAA